MKIGDLVEHRMTDFIRRNPSMEEAEQCSLGKGIVIQCYTPDTALYAKVYWYSHTCYGSFPAADLRVISES